MGHCGVGERGESAGGGGGGRAKERPGRDGSRVLQLEFVPTVADSQSGGGGKAQIPKCYIVVSGLV
jgi:hypothetical protein